VSVITVVQCPTQGEFIARAIAEFDAVLKTKPTGLVRSGIGPVLARWLERPPKGGRRRESIIDDACYDGVPLSAFTLRSLCTKLGIPYITFGLVLSDPS